MKPWHDCPRCETCHGPLSTRAPAGFYPGKDLRCMACGKQTAGSQEAWAQAHRADEAWEVESERVRLASATLTLGERRVWAAAFAGFMVKNRTAEEAAEWACGVIGVFRAVAEPSSILSAEARSMLAEMVGEGVARSVSRGEAAHAG
jgi:hypothetical protein